MRELCRKINAVLVMFGLDFRQMLNSMRGIVSFFLDLNKLKKQKVNSAAPFDFKSWYPCLGDRFSNSGVATGHYFHQDLLVARKIYQNNPVTHLDVASRIDGFVAHVAVFRQIKVVDVRPLEKKVKNIDFIQADMMSQLSAELIESCDSLSCLHAIEHFGLGRYGDPINFDGYLIGLDNLYKILKHEGKLYLSMPIGPQRIEFNAHRVFSIAYLLTLFKDKFIVNDFAYVDDKGDLHENCTLTQDEIERNYGCHYGCGIFELIKK